MAEKSTVVRGMPKSGRFWKTEKKRFSSMAQVKPLRSSWDKKIKQRFEEKSLKKHVAEINEMKKEKEELRKKQRAAKIQKKKENERKAEIVQVIRNTTKIKKMSKKTLRKIEKRDTNL